MSLLRNYLSKIEFDSYEDFCENFKLNVPKDFDFAKDIVDRWAEIEPEKLALLYCDDEGLHRRFTFAEISSLFLERQIIVDVVQCNQQFLLFGQTRCPEFRFS